MAVSSGILAGSILDAQVLKNYLDSEIPVRVTSSQSASKKETTNIELTLDTVSVTGVESDELLIFLFQHSCSIGDSGAALKCWSTIGGTDMANYAYSKTFDANIDGTAQTQFTIAVATGQTGTVACTQRLIRDSGTGSVYSLRRQYHIFQFKFRT
jgi:hypothetical protein